jgi:hypothetical protein
MRVAAEASAFGRWASVASACAWHALQHASAPDCGAPGFVTSTWEATVWQQAMAIIWSQGVASCTAACTAAKGSESRDSRHTRNQARMTEF